MKKAILLFVGFLSTYALTQTSPIYVAGSGVIQPNLCTGSFYSICQSLGFTDTDAAESLSLTFTSSDQSILPDANILGYLSNNVGSLFEFNIDASAIAAGTVTVTVTATGLDALSTNKDIIVTFIQTQNPVFSQNPLTVCSSTPLVNLNDYVDQAGGSWDFTVYETSIPGGLFYTNSFGLSNGSSYFLSFSNVVNGCNTSGDLEIIYFDGPTATISTSNLSSCNSNDGTATATIVSPNGGEQITWTTGDIGTYTISNLAAGMYGFYLTDAVGCKIEEQFTVNNSGIDDVATIVNPTCNNYNNGSISVSSITGMTAPISYIWSSGHSTATISNMSAGSYILHATDVNGCEANFSYTITEPEPLNINYFSYYATCGFSDGTIDIYSTTGGNGTYTYNWSNGMIGDSITNLFADQYELTLTDQLGCSKVYSISLPNGSFSYVYGNSTDVNCGLNNGAIDVSTSIDASTALAGFLWSTGAISEDVSNLSSGNYWCKMFTTDGCIAIGNWEIKTIQPAKQEICVVTVDSTTTTNLVVWEPLETVGISHYIIYRETENFGEFLQIDTVNADNLSVFNDVVASPEVQSWRYRISAVNTCGIESEISVPHRTIHLSMLDAGAGQTKIVWSPYEGAVFTDYLIYRRENGIWSLVGTVPNTQTAFIDNIDVNTPGLDYIVEFELTDFCQPSLIKINDFNSSRSNRERGTFAVGEGTGDSNNELVEVNLEHAKIYPNPFENKLIIELERASDFSVSIVDINGKTIKTIELTNIQNEIELNDIQKGYYFIELKNQSSVKRTKILKQ